ncbi:DNA polymerase III subunit gamma/tau [Aidingimonas halophila]|uniref:DNA polymerase III subunit gamma/tau n=1 Tax=Aidingimonas halophila TaxID=574349 RepID=A0A1H3ES93_9GAMM|nr:DNA polymerase III subunit gamma/tau [Aidingimonas halophila]GHC31617.1 DNA polymerase III subunit gamma/tau [Aidingimonas halophila]SDX81495.1 DNA polymerase-3 subunit gamma/tau [Aidingimonas halophila]
MSYQVLARKWRPRTFHELVGQEHVRRALVNALDQGRLHHAYLFTGTRGVGKTTLARILAKCLNCTANGRGDDGVTSRPCGECENCRMIEEGRFVDLIEVDAASRTKVEDTRELLDNVQYAPTQGRYKVYLVDEVHMLSTHSFNALLKTLEEPPPHVKFLLATTDPQKLPVTVLSRCLQFSLKNMPPEPIVDYLSRVLEAESVPFDESALWLLGKAANGSMRDAMSLTDQAIALGQGEIHHSDVSAMLGTLDHRHLLALMEALAEVDAQRVLSEVASLAEQGPDFAGVLDDLVGMLHRLAVAQMVPEALDNGQGDRDTLLALAARFTAEDVQLYYQIGLQGRGDMSHAPDLRSALEMTLLRMLAFRPQGVPKPAKTPLPMRSPTDTSSAGPPSVDDSAAAHEAPPIDDSEVTERAAAVPEPKPMEDIGDAVHADLPEPESFETAEASELPPAEAETALSPPAAVAVDETPIPTPESAEALSDSGLSGTFSHDDWLALFDRLDLGGLTRNLAAHCMVDTDDGSSLVLRLDPSQAAMNADIHVERIQNALAGAGIERRLSIVDGQLSEGVETPRARSQRLESEQRARAVEALQDDPHIQQIQQTFGARLVESTVKAQASERETH